MGELGTTLAVTSNWRTLMRRLLVTASVVPSSPILVTLMKEVLSSLKRRFLQESHGVTSQKTSFSVGWDVFYVLCVISNTLHIMKAKYMLIFLNFLFLHICLLRIWHTLRDVLDKPQLLTFQRSLLLPVTNLILDHMKGGTCPLKYMMSHHRWQ
jgi:hypothetical protein